MVSPGTVRVSLVSRDTLTQRVPGWVGDGESQDCQSYLVSQDALTQRVPGWVGDGESRDC